MKRFLLLHIYDNIATCVGPLHVVSAPLHLLSPTLELARTNASPQGGQHTIETKNTCSQTRQAFISMYITLIINVLTIIDCA